MRSHCAPPSVLFIQQFTPLYDIALYRQLADDHKMSLSVAADFDTKDSLNQNQGDLPYQTHSIGFTKCRGLLYARGLFRVVRSVRPDVVIALGNPRLITLPFFLAWCRLQGTPTAVWGMFHRHGPSRLSTRLAYRLMARLSQLCLVYGNRGAGELGKIGVPPDKIQIVSTGVDADQIGMAAGRISEMDTVSFRRDRGLLGKRVFLQVARLIEPKRTDLLLEALALTRQVDPSVTVVLVGDGPERGRLEQMAAAMNLRENVIFSASTFDIGELALWHRCSIASVCAGAAGLLVHQSLAFGTPVILHSDTAFHGTEAEAVIAGETGLHFEKENASDLARTLLYAASHQKELNQMGTRAQHLIAERYTIREKARRFDTAIGRLAGYTRP